MRLPVLASLLLLAPAVAHADEFDGQSTLSTDDKATIEADRKAAHDAIDKKYDGDTSNDARKARQAEYQQADQDVLQKKGLSEKDYMMQNVHNRPEESKAIEEKSKAIGEKRKADAAEAEKKKADEANAAPEVVKGFDEQHPLDMSGEPTEKKPPKLDEEGNPIPEVEKLKPEDDPNGGQMPPEEPVRKKKGKHKSAEY